ncbi:hypothetical protein SAMN04489722_104113 [Algibacter lectus]|uniref:DUF4044 domain-containing protein n=1 Tax=Algibacter lectus TaxID=221126 RepID=UPI0008E42A8E|nr:DUF4044 domain-containing protein [Algibacter lectus]SFC94400.1 hypothetical protein SAMN04489722_104113 [Algibacter lectus]
MKKKSKMDKLTIVFIVLAAIFSLAAVLREKYKSAEADDQNEEWQDSIGNDIKVVKKEAERKKYFDGIDFSVYQRFFPNGGFTVCKQEKGEDIVKQIYNNNPLLDISEVFIQQNKNHYSLSITPTLLSDVDRNNFVSGIEIVQYININLINKSQSLDSLIKFEGYSRSFVIIKNEPYFLYIIGAFPDK